MRSALRWWPARWQLWQLAPRVVIYLLAWVAAAGLVVAWSAARQSITGEDVVELVVLAVCAVGYDEVSRRLERQRLGIARGPHVSMRSVFSFVAACLVPVSLFAVLAAVIYVHASIVGAREHARSAPHRAVFNTATMVVSGAAASWALTLADPPGGSAVERVAVFALAATAYFAVNLVAVTGVLISVRGRPERGDLGTRADNLLALATLGLGATAALLGAPWALLLAVPCMYLLQRSALTEELETAATQDAKTGLLNAATWHAVAEAELLRSQQLRRPVAVLVVDLDRFKAINDTHGHLVGDVVLAGVARCLTGTLRDHDRIGRFGGEEFVAVLPGLGGAEAVTVAERVRARVASWTPEPENAAAASAVPVTASIGVAAAPEHGSTVTELLAAADAAMYAAKREGRDRVVLSEPADPAA